jgi:flagellar M-ring protein FliF
MTQFQEQVTYQRALEGELARTIQALDSIASARVHLAIPKPSVFIRDQQKPSASVLVNLYSGHSLEGPQVSAIVHLVASSVPELDAKNVTVVDQAGNLLTTKGDLSSMQGLSSGQLDYLRDVEGYYAKRIESIIMPIVGAGNVKAEVQADLDFSEDESTSESYKPNPTPDTQSVRSQQTMSDSSGGGGAAGGIPGALSNQPPGPATAPLNAPAGANAGATPGAGGAAAQAGGGKRDSVTNFELDKTIRHVRESLGRIKRLSVAVVVNYKASSEPDAKPAPLPPQLLDQVNNLVKEAVGYNQARGDTINVVNTAFSEAGKVEEVETPLWKDPSNVAMVKELLKNLLIFGLAFYLVFGVLRPLLRDLVRPPEVTAAEGPGFEAEDMGGGFDVLGGGVSPGEHHAADNYQHSIGTVRDFAKQNPKIVAEVVKEWMTKE